MQTFLPHLVTITQAVLLQLIGVLGIFFLFGFILARLQKYTARQYLQSVGWKGILWTGWIGTPIHELGHAFFCKLFRHKITEMYLFRPNEADGGLGHVDHTFNRFSLYQRMGNFFIGAAPMIWGSAIMVVLLYLLVPNAELVFAPLMENTSVFSTLNGIGQSMVNLFSPDNLSSWRFWVFFYLSVAIASHLAPSRADQKNMWGGLIFIIFLLVIGNAIALFLDINLTAYILKINQMLGVLSSIFIYAIIISLLHFILASLLLWPFRYR